MASVAPAQTSWATPASAIARVPSVRAASAGRADHRQGAADGTGRLGRQCPEPGQRQDRALEREGVEGPAPMAAFGEQAADQGAAQGRAAPDRRHHGHGARHQDAREQSIGGDIGRDDHPAAAQALKQAPDQQRRHVRRGARGEAAERVGHRRQDQAAAQADLVDEGAGDRAAQDGAQLIKRDAPMDEGDPAEFIHRRGHDRGGEERIGRVKPDPKAQKREPAQVSAGDQGPPTRVLPPRVPRPRVLRPRVLRPRGRRPNRHAHPARARDPVPAGRLGGTGH